MDPKVAYDGWALAYQPNSTAALHLLTLLELHPHEIPAQLFLPADTIFEIPPAIEVHLQYTPNRESEHLRWEQRLLPRITEASKIALIHLTSGVPALFSRLSYAISPAEVSQKATGEKRGIAQRLREALAQGSLERGGFMLWPADLPLPELPAPIELLPPIVHPGFLPSYTQQCPAPDKLPETYILCHGPQNLQDFKRLLDIWSWAAPSIGDNYPLVVIGLDAQQRIELGKLAQVYALQETLLSLPTCDLAHLIGLYQSCSAFLHPGSTPPWGGPLRLALACAKPIVAQETSFSDALVGTAAYLVEKGSSAQAQDRAFGAAIISVIVESSLAQKFSQAAAQRVSRWSEAAFVDGLRSLYTRLLAR